MALEPGGGASFAVVGTTGAYAVAVCGLKGYVVEERGRLLIDGHRVAGFREVRRAARALKGRLEVARTFTEVAPMICLARAAAGASRTHQGVRVVRLEDLVAEIAKRERTVDPSSAERGARRLGRVLSGSGGAVDE